MRSPGSKYVFGPVPSRRLGRSLGVDIVPFKTCTFDCIYCQLGRTTERTVERKEWVPVDKVVDELRSKLGSEPDYITVSGSGEPTLHSGIGELIDRIRSITDIPVAVLTNGSLLWNEDVRASLGQAHLVVPSLDAGEKGLFHVINRPHPDVTFEGLLDGLIRFRQEFRGEYWLEVLLLAGYTALEKEVRKIADIASRIQPDRVHLNTSVRPPAEEFAFPADRRRLVELSGLFSPCTEVIADSRVTCPRQESEADDLEIVQMIRRRPCTLLDVSAGLRIHPAQAAKKLNALVHKGRAEVRRAGNRQNYYVAISGKPK
jgi:wyosine [tRNA(Phe)-imidazoG37] synthetase (radical SAM superfamily)